MANYVTNAALAIITNRIKGAGTEPLHIAWGTGAGALSAASTALSTESRSAATSGGDVIRVAGTSSRTTTTQTNDTYSVTGTMTADAGKTITNVGLFDSSGAQVSPGPPSGGNLFVASDGQSVALSASDTLTLTFNIVFA